MPELPEVEVVKRSLTNKVQNLIIKEVRINDGRLRYVVDKNKIRKLIGLKLEKIERRSKFLLFFFSLLIINSKKWVEVYFNWLPMEHKMCI